MFKETTKSSYKFGQIGSRTLFYMKMMNTNTCQVNRVDESWDSLVDYLEIVMKKMYKMEEQQC